MKNHRSIICRRVAVVVACAAWRGRGGKAEPARGGFLRRAPRPRQAPRPQQASAACPHRQPPPPPPRLALPAAPSASGSPPAPRINPSNLPKSSSSSSKPIIRYRRRPRPTTRPRWSRPTSPCKDARSTGLLFEAQLSRTRRRIRRRILKSPVVDQRPARSSRCRAIPRESSTLAGRVRIADFFLEELFRRPQSTRSRGVRSPLPVLEGVLS